MHTFLYTDLKKILIYFLAAFVLNAGYIFSENLNDAEIEKTLVDGEVKKSSKLKNKVKEKIKNYGLTVNLVESHSRSLDIDHPNQSGEFLTSNYINYFTFGLDSGSNYIYNRSKDELSPKGIAFSYGIKSEQQAFDMTGESSIYYNAYNFTTDRMYVALYYSKSEFKEYGYSYESQFGFSFGSAYVRSKGISFNKATSEDLYSYQELSNSPTIDIFLEKSKLQYFFITRGFSDIHDFPRAILTLTAQNKNDLKNIAYYHIFTYGVNENLLSYSLYLSQQPGSKLSVLEQYGYFAGFWTYDYEVKDVAYYGTIFYNWHTPYFVLKFSYQTPIKFKSKLFNFKYDEFVIEMGYTVPFGRFIK